MAKNLSNADAVDSATPSDSIVVAQQGDGVAASTGASATAQPVALDDCAVTDQHTTLRLPVLDNDTNADGQGLDVVALTQPASGRAEIADDGSIRFTPAESGLQEIRYVVEDGAGKTADAKVNIFVNAADDAATSPVLAGIGDEGLSGIARSCVDGMALDVVRLAGDQVVIDMPAPGQRIQVATTAGQQIDLRDDGFVDATYIVVDGGLLVVSEGGRMVFLDGFVEASDAADPASLSIAGSPSVGGDVLLANLQPIVGATNTDVASSDLAEPSLLDVQPAAGPGGPSHGGGAGFSPYDPGAIGSGPDALGPLGPTALSFGTEEFVLGDPAEDVLSTLGDDSITPIDPGIPGDPDGPGGPNDPGIPGGPDNPGDPVNQAPTLSITANISVEIGEVTNGGPTFVEGPPLPDLAEGRSIDNGAINGVNAHNLVIGDGGDAAIIFRDEVALYQNSVGVYLIGENGEMLDPKLAFVAVEHADPFFDEDGNQQFAFIRPGGGDLSPGDQVLLSELYPDQDLPPGAKFGLFLVVDGGRTGQLDGTENLEFENGDGEPATIFDTSPPTLLAGGHWVDADVFHVIDTGSPNASSNQLNPGGKGQAISGLVDDGAGLTIGFEDVRLGLGDDDFNDTVIDVLPTPGAVSSLPFVNLNVAVDATVFDADDANLTRAVVEISSGAAPGDRLEITSSLDGTGISLVEDGTSGMLVLEGVATIEAYQEVLRGLQFRFGDGESERELSFQVTDEAGNASNTEIVTITPSSLTADIGTEGADTLAGADDTDNAIAGRGGDDSLFGANGNDILDGGLGNDFLFGDAGDDLLIGGPGADVINGGDGADEHRYFSIIDRGDRIEGFNAEEGDVLNFSDLLGNDDGSGNIEDFIRFETVGNDIEISVDVDGGGGGFGFVSYVTLVDPVGVTTLEEAASNGTIIT